MSIVVLLKLRSIFFPEDDERLNKQRTSMLLWLLLGLNVINFTTGLVTIPLIGEYLISIVTFALVQLFYVAGYYFAKRGYANIVGFVLSLGISVLFFVVSKLFPGPPIHLHLLLVPLFLAGFVLKPAFVLVLCAIQIAGVVAIAATTPPQFQVSTTYFIFTGIVLLVFSAVSVLNGWNQRKNAKHLYALYDELKVAREEEQLARQEAEQASKAKSHYLASMSHELRTPLTAILGYSEIVAEELADMPECDPMLQQDMSRINTAGRHLMELLSDVLDMSKIEAGRMTILIEPFNAAGLVREVVEMVRPLAGQRRNTVEMVIAGGGSSIMSSDRTKVRQILFNLMSNAAKFTEDGIITLTLNTAAEDGMFVFEVLDTGIGMSPEALEKVFTEFVQADVSTTRDFGGTGLGLALCEQFAKILGGCIEVASDEGEGACFSVYLPRLSDAVNDAHMDDV